MMIASGNARMLTQNGCHGNYFYLAWNFDGGKEVIFLLF